MNPVGTKLIQIQKDRFIHNWRKVGEGDKYRAMSPSATRSGSNWKPSGRSSLAKQFFGHLLINQSVDVVQGQTRARMKKDHKYHEVYGAI